MSSPSRTVPGHFVALLLLLATGARAEGPPAPPAPALPPPVALGGECRLLVSCPWSGPLAAHLRLGGLVVLGQDGDPRPVSVVPSGALSVSLWRWAEAGAMFSARGGAAKDGGPALLQLPITLWARLSPQIGTSSGFGVAAEVRHAIGRGPFDAAGTVYADSTSGALSVGYRKGRVEAFATGAYQEAAERSYRGLEAGGGLYVLVLRSLGLQLGAEALGRVGREGTDAVPSWTAAAVLRFADEHGVSGTIGSGAGGGPGMPGRMPLAFFFGLSFGPEYRAHPVEPGYESLREAVEGWLTDSWRRRPRYGLPSLPGFGLYAGPDLAATARDPHRITDPLTGYCGRLSGFSSAAVSALALQSCVLSAGPLAPTAGPPAPAPPVAPQDLPGLAGGPQRAGRGAVPSRLRTGRGTGWTDPDTQAPDPAGLSPTFWAGGRPGGAALNAAAAPPPPPAIPLDPPRPQALPPGVRPESVPPFLRPAPQQRGVAEHALAPMAPAGPHPAPRPPPGPVEPAPAEQQEAVHAAPATAATAPPRPAPDYTSLPPPRTIGNKRFTPMQKREIKAANAAANGGTLRDDYGDEALVPAQQSRSGVTPPEREVAIDHRIPVAKGGTNDYSNARVTSRKRNTDKGARMPTEQER